MQPSLGGSLLDLSRQALSGSPGTAVIWSVE